jgi:hypothetical protein
VKNYLIALVLGLGSGIAITKRYWPTVQVKESVKIVTKVETKQRVVTKEVIMPNGQKETTTTIDTAIASQSEASKSLAPARPDWFFNVTTTRQTDVFRIGINRRFLGQFYFTGTVDNKGELMFGLGLEF